VPSKPPTPSDLTPRPASRALFPAVFCALTILAVAPLWLSRILPMQDYPQILLLARAWGDCRDPGSPFSGTYTTGFPLAPLLLPILALRALGALVGLETAGRLMWTLYAVGLPLASLHLLTVLRRDRWAVLIVFPLVISYWVTGGFFAFATAAPLFVLGLAIAVRWLEAPSWGRGAALAAVLSALHLWHSLVLAQLLLDFGVLWLLARAGSVRERLLALLPALPALALFAVWMRVAVLGRSHAAKPPVWRPWLDNARSFFDSIAPEVPGAARAAMVFAIVLALALAAPGRSAPSPEGRFRVRNPFAWLALMAALGAVVLPLDVLGVEGIQNRQPWIAALLLVFGYSLPARRAWRSALLGLIAGAGAIALISLGRRVAAFDRESAGASRLIDRLGPGETLLAPMRGGSTVSFPGKPLVGVEVYASIRHGGLPNMSFAGYDVNVVHYVDGKNPMPGLIVGWLDSPGLLRFDYVLQRSPNDMAAKRPDLLRRVATDGDWALYAVCGKDASRCP
jgi:hypothetical protein